MVRLNKQIKKARATKMVQGHLLNHHLGGLAIPENLYPITSQANANHKSHVENHVKKEVITNQKPVRYTVNVSGAHNTLDPSATFHCRVEAEDGEGGFKQVLAKDIRSEPGVKLSEEESVFALDGDTLPGSVEFANRLVTKGWGKVNRRGMGNYAYDHPEAPTAVVDPTADGRVHATITSPSAPGGPAEEEKTSDDPTGGL